MNEAPIIVEIAPVVNKLNVPEESFGNLTAEPKKKWFSLKKSEKTVRNDKIVHEIVILNSLKVKYIFIFLE